MYRVLYQKDKRRERAGTLNTVENFTPVCYNNSDSKRKLGGAYVTVTGRVKKVDDYQRLLVLTDGTKIPLGEILDIESELFSKMEGEN